MKETKDPINVSREDLEKIVRKCLRPTKNKKYGDFSLNIRQLFGELRDISSNKKQNSK